MVDLTPLRLARFALLAALLVALLGLAAVPAAGACNPLRGLHFFVDRQYSAPYRTYRAWRHSRPGDARLIFKIARQPTVKAFGGYTQDPRSEVRAYLDRLDEQAPGATPLVNLYRLPHERCGGYDAGGRSGASSYKGWINGFVQAVGSHSMVIFLEEDSIISTPCLSRSGLATRLSLLRYATSHLARLRHVVIYQDAGAEDALSPGRTARLLKRAGIGSTNGFMLNPTHFDGTAREIRYGKAISKRLGGKHFVVNTAVNGRGPLLAADHVHELLCNPPGRGLGTAPTLETPSPLVDGLLWTGEPGHSNGRCHRGDAAPGSWWPQYALGLARRAAF